MKKTHSVAIFLCVLCFYSCKKNNDTVASPNFQVDVYVAGYEMNTIGVSIAKYWKNGSPVSLTDGSNSARATSIAVSGNDVYVTTQEWDVTHSVAKLWKNGNPVTLIDGSPYAQANSIAVSGADVYIAGDEEDNQNNGVAKYWRNGVPVVLNPALGFSEAGANSIAVSGADVYVGGGSDDGSGGMAEYWKNGIPVILNDPAEFFGTAMSIAISGNDIYVAVEKIAIRRTAAIWKNGMMTDLLDSTYETFVSSIAVSGNNVYAAGGIFDGINGVARYWKNGTPVQLGLQDIYASSVALSGNDVYVAGTGFNGHNGVAKYWKNGIPVILTDGSNDARATSIFISKQ